MKNFKISTFLSGIIVLFTFTAYSQKLPKVQVVSMRAPNDVKIDGRLTEWGQLQAHNPATDISYTLANDNENIYLTVQAAYMETINKIVNGGITFTIQPSANKKEPSKASITYPVKDAKTTLHLSPYSVINLGGQLVRDTSARSVDSLMNRQNSQLAKYCTGIKLNGLEGIDTLISVYNTEGIKAAAQVDNKEIYTLELALPLKYAKFLTASDGKFYYNIRVNGIKNTRMYELFGSAPVSVIQSNNEQIARQTSPTDFWGKYTLVKAER